MLNISPSLDCILMIFVVALSALLVVVDASASVVVAISYQSKIIKQGHAELLHKFVSSSHDVKRSHIRNEKKKKESVDNLNFITLFQ
jgi:hypothetical protein